MIMITTSISSWNLLFAKAFSYCKYIILIFGLCVLILVPEIFVYVRYDSCNMWTIM